MPTFAEAVVAELAKSGQLERLKPLGDLYRLCLKMYEGMFLMVGAIAARAQQRCPSKAYSAFFEDQGFDATTASALGSLILSRAKREADEAKTEAKVTEAIRFFTKGGGQKRAIVRRAKLVLEAKDNTSIVDALFVDARGDECEFLRLLRTAVDGGAIDRERIQTIAAATISRRPPARGRKASQESVAHQLFLESNNLLKLRDSYTWNAYENDFVDPRTRATRLEFDNPRFSPRSARRRLKRRGSAEAGRSGSPSR